MNEKKTLIRCTDGEIKKLLTDRRDEAILKYKVEVQRFHAKHEKMGFFSMSGDLTEEEVAKHGESVLSLLNNILLAQRALERGYE
ncbi:hypothetical protein P1O43_001725 [Salmonella enterica]|nr:hypothetical protein [Salmonella enterica]